MDKFGRILLPKALRRHLMVRPGDEVQITVDDTARSITISVSKEDTAHVDYTEWGLPVIHSPGEFPAGLDYRGVTREGYQGHY